MMAFRAIITRRRTTADKSYGSWEILVNFASVELGFQNIVLFDSVCKIQ